MTQLRSLPDYSTIQRGNGLFDSGPQIKYLTIVLQTSKYFLWVMTYDSTNNRNSLHKHNHDRQPDYEAALTVLGYREDR